MIRFIIIIIFFAGCKEFYDEEFEEFEELQSQTVADEANFSAELVSTDSSLESLSGSGGIVFSGDEASVEVKLKGIPGNIGQITYSILFSPCSSFALSVPRSNQDERTVEIRERLGRSSLLEDLRSAGAASTDLTLDGKSFVVRGTPQFAGLPNPSGTNELIIACGRLTDESPNRNEALDVFFPSGVNQP